MLVQILIVTLNTLVLTAKPQCYSSFKIIQQGTNLTQSSSELLVNINRNIRNESLKFCI
jgi:hypothetical protein